MKIGTFTQQEDGYTGLIDTAGLRVADVTFSPMPVKQGSGPDFIILAAGDDDSFEVGAAWKKTSKAGKPYLSVKLDSPAFVTPINCALIPNNGGSHTLVWNRKDDAPADEQAAA
jgi:uncharacterized protein (DUF736 family)